MPEKNLVGVPDWPDVSVLERWAAVNWNVAKTSETVIFCQQVARGGFFFYLFVAIFSKERDKKENFCAV